MNFLAQTPEWTTLTRGRANLIDWLARINERPSMRKATWADVAQLAKAE